MGKRIIYDNGFHDFESDTEADAYILTIPANYPFTVQDITAEVEAKKAKKDKEKNFIFKGNTIAALRNELNEWIEMRK